MQFSKTLDIAPMPPGLSITPEAISHPHENAYQATPKKFIIHKTNDERQIYTNIPKRCFTDGRLICHRLRPVFPGPGTVDKPKS